MSWREIERVELPSPREFQRKYLAGSRPAVFTNAMDHWPAREMWTPEYFKSRYGDIKLLVQNHEALTGEASGPIEEQYAEQRLGDYIDDLLTPEQKTGYIVQCPLLDAVPELRHDVDFPPFFSPLSRPKLQLWIGPANTNSKLHYDQDENLFAQIYGRKRIILAPPEATKYCYPTNVTWGEGYSPIHPHDPDLTHYPLFAKVRRYQTVLGPGEILYIPLRWWHDVTALEPAISVNLWWWPPKLMIRNVAYREWDRLSKRLTGKLGVSYGPR